MIITRTPYRISFFGGGTDYQAFYSRHGGMCLTSTIDKYCHVLMRPMPPFLGSKYRVFWSQMECVDRIEDIKHSGVRGCLQFLGIEFGIEVNHAGDLPARSGLGSSSAFTVGMLHALRAYQKRSVGRGQLAQEAIEVEQGVLRETVGVQDQIECSWGGLNVIQIDRDGTYTVKPLNLTPEEAAWVEDHLLLVFTGIQRYASEIAAVQVDNVERKERELLDIMALVPEAEKALLGADIRGFGELLHQSWMLKRSLTDKISSPEIDQIYDTARRHGAWGGKVLGAGGGGFMLLCAPLERHQGILAALELVAIPVRFEYGGSQVVLNA